MPHRRSSRACSSRALRPAANRSQVLSRDPGC
jgi:hypothetical protein